MCEASTTPGGVIANSLRAGSWWLDTQDHFPTVLACLGKARRFFRFSLVYI